MMNRSFLFSLVLMFFSGLSITAQTPAVAQDDMTAQCVKAGFEIKPKSANFDLHKYQKAFLVFDRIDQFRKENESNVFSLENGEATITLYSAAMMAERYNGKISPMGDKLPPLRFVLNVNGQVKEQPLN